MRRGPPPAKGFDVAIPVALMRGDVMLFQRSPGNVCDFTIAGNGILAMVRLMMILRLHATIAEITIEYAAAVHGLCTIPFGGPVSRELWLYTRHGTLRFFRVTETGLVEIDYFGFPFVNGKPVTLLPAFPGANLLPTGPAAPGQPGAGTGTARATGPAAGPALPGGLDSKSPIARWLAKKNAGKKPGDQEAAADRTDPADPGKNTGAGWLQPVPDGPQVPPAGAVSLPKEPAAAGQAGEPGDSPTAREPDSPSPPGKSRGVF
jgi:hypothetical protein